MTLEQMQKGKMQVPLVPLIPTMSIVANIVLMLHLSPITWIRLAIWLTVGLLTHSRLSDPRSMPTLT